MSMIALLPGLILAAAATIASPLPEDSVREAVTGVYADGRYQAMPAPGETPASVDPARPDWPGRGSGDGSSGKSGGGSGGRGVDLPGSSGDLSGLVSFLAWAMIGTMLALALVWLAREWAPIWPGGPMRRRRKEAARSTKTTVTTVPVVEERRPEYQVHAEEGRFPEAIHALLLAVLFEIGRRRRRPFESALTSREILPRSGLEAEAKDDLGGIVRTVEASIFGGAEVGRSNYEDCVDRYGRVIGALSGGRV